MRPSAPVQSDRRPGGAGVSALALLLALGCEPPGPPPEEPATCDGGEWVRTVAGAIVHETGTPLADAYAQLCVLLPLRGGVKACLVPTTTSASGAFLVDVPDDAECMHDPVLRVVQPATGLAGQYCRLPPSASDEVTLATPYTLYDTDAATTLPPAGEPSAERTVVFEGGLELDFTPSAYFGPEDGYAQLRARRFAPDTPGLCFLPEGHGLEALYTVIPEGDVQGPGFPVRVPNDTNLPAGTAVDLFVLAGLGCTLADGTLLETGDWVRYGAGSVSSDGTTIVGDPLPCISWFGYSRAP